MSMFLVTTTTNTQTICSIASTSICSTTENSAGTYSVLRSRSSIDSITNFARRFVIHPKIFLSA